MSTYNVEDIFHDIPGDTENVMMTIPPEILNQLGWVEGDTIKITAEDGKITLSKK